LLLIFGLVYLMLWTGGILQSSPLGPVPLLCVISFSVQNAAAGGRGLLSAFMHSSSGQPSRIQFKLSGAK